jgi:RNA polymerase sigma factor (sigma-70 family)
MATGQLNHVLHHLRQLVATQHGQHLTDGVLLERFVTTRDEAAFAALVERHGPLVLSVCGRVLRHNQEAEDACQATFLVLARKAAGIRKRTSVSSWLHGVAYRIALKMRVRQTRRSRHQKPLADVALPDNTAELTWRDMQVVLDEELNRMPDKYRAPLVLCYLEGKTRDEAAQHLGWTPGTLRGRLERGRELLRARLSRRGLGLSAALLGSVLAQRAAPAAVPAEVAVATIKAALPFLTGKKATPGVTARALALALEASKGGWGIPLKIAAVVCLVLGVLAGGPALVAPRTGAAHPLTVNQEEEPKPAAPQAAPPRPGSGKQPRTDRYGDPLPAGAIARIGTVRFRHGNAVYTVAWSPDGKTVASDGGDGMIRLWQAADGKELHAFPARAEDRNSLGSALAFSPDGKTLAGIGRDYWIHLWDVTTGKEKLKFGRAAYGVDVLAFAQNGKALVSGGSNVEVRLWDTATGKQMRSGEGKGPGLAVSPGGGLLLMVDRQLTMDKHAKMVRVVKTDTAKELHALRVSPDHINTAALTADGKTAGLPCADRTVRLFGTATGKEVYKLDPKLPRGTSGGIYGVALSPDGKTVAAGCTDGTIHVWSAVTGKELHILRGHSWWVVSLVFAADGKTLVSGSWDGAVRFWNVVTGKELARSHDLRHSVRFSRTVLSPDGKSLITGGGGGEVCIWETVTGKKRRALAGHAGTVFGLALAADGRTLASGGTDNTIRLWDLATGQEKRQLSGINNPKSGRIENVTFSPDGKTLASVGEGDGVIRLWQVRTGKELRRLRHEAGACLCFSPDGTRLVSGGWDAKIHLWEVGTGKELYQVQPEKDPQGGRQGTFVDLVVFSPDGQTLASGGHDHIIRLWDAATGQELRRLKGHQGGRVVGDLLPRWQTAGLGQPRWNGPPVERGQWCGTTPVVGAPRLGHVGRFCRGRQVAGFRGTGFHGPCLEGARPALG